MAVSAFFSLELWELEHGWNHDTAQSFQLSTSVLPSVVLSGHNKYVQINKNEKQEGMFRVSP